MAEATLVARRHSSDSLVPVDRGRSAGVGLLHRDAHEDVVALQEALLRDGRAQGQGFVARPSKCTDVNLRPSMWRSALARVIGRAAFYVCLYSVYAALLFSAVFRVYGFPQRGQVLDLAAFALPILLACVFLAGFAWPVEAVPTWLRSGSLFLPSTAGITGFLRLAEMGASLTHVRFEWTVLWGRAALYFALALVSERRSALSTSQNRASSCLWADTGAGVTAHSLTAPAPEAAVDPGTAAH